MWSVFSWINIPFGRHARCRLFCRFPLVKLRGECEQEDQQLYTQGILEVRICKSGKGNKETDHHRREKIRFIVKAEKIIRFFIVIVSVRIQRLPKSTRSPFCIETSLNVCRENLEQGEGEEDQLCILFLCPR